MINKFFDLQVNGYAGVDFNQDDLNADDLHLACVKLKQDNLQGVLATIITADSERMIRRLHRIVQLCEQDPLISEVIHGIHIEGPFLSKEVGFRGAHNPEWIREAHTDLMKKMLDAAAGLTRIVTLAPEVDEAFRVTKMLAENKIVVSAGHCNPSLDVLNRAIDNGLSMFTHLGNGCPAELVRHDNIIQRVLSLKDKLWINFIADGLHIPLFALKNYLKLSGIEKSIIVTDSMAAASAEPGIYSLGELEMEVGSDGIVRVQGQSNFAGSSVTMQKSRQILLESLGFSSGSVNRMLYVNPLRALGISG